MSEVCYFEIPFEQQGRAQEFYEKLFGWKFERFGADGPEEEAYWTIDTGEQTSAAPPKLMGGLLKKKCPGHTTMIYINIENMEEKIEEVKSLGGKLQVEKTPVPKRGYFAVCLDPEMNAFGLWKTDETAG